MKKLSLVMFAALALFVVLPAHAQTGCDTSPENPTAILALVGSAGGFFAVARSRFGRK